MTFLQPWMLYGLPVVLLPVLIHLLNRLRYRTVHWAAMIFLLRADRKAARRAQIKQWLLLAIRILVLGLLVLALSRPILGGWLGWASSGGPDLVVILLDRSASMETVDPRYQVSRREQGLRLLANVAAEQDQTGHFVLIDSATREPLPLQNLQQLPRLTQAGPSNSACDWPALLRQAAETIEKDNVARAEIWIVSDLQASNWNPENGEWKSLLQRLSKETRQVSIRLLDLSGPTPDDLHLTLQGVRTRRLENSARLELDLVCYASEEKARTTPLTINLNGARQTREVRIQGRRSLHTLSFELDSLPTASGWGRIDLPPDVNVCNNTAWFVFGQSLPMHGCVIAESAPLRQTLRCAAAPDPKARNRTAVAAEPEEAGKLPFDERSMVIWQGGPPTKATELAIKNVLSRGGAVVVFPPADTANRNLEGIEWGELELAPDKAFFPVSSWDELDGPLMNADDGTPLPLARLQVIRRRTPRPTTDPSLWHTYAAFTDGTPLLLGRSLNGGQVYLCATLPDRRWSSLENGFILVPMIHRIFEEAAAATIPPAFAECGTWKPADRNEVWLPATDTKADTESEGPVVRDWRAHSGVYAAGARQVALNVPAVESKTETVEPNTVTALLAPLDVQIVEKAMNKDTDSMLTEVASAGIAGMMALMLLESLLILGWTTRSNSP